MNYTVSDLDIQALVDNELDEENQARVIKYLSHNLKARQRYEQLLAQRQKLQEWWRSSRQ